MWVIDDGVWSLFFYPPHEDEFANFFFTLKKFTLGKLYYECGPVYFFNSWNIIFQDITEFMMLLGEFAPTLACMVTIVDDVTVTAITSYSLRGFLCQIHLTTQSQGSRTELFILELGTFPSLVYVLSKWKKINNCLIFVSKNYCQAQFQWTSSVELELTITPQLK